MNWMTGCKLSVKSNITSGHQVFGTAMATNAVADLQQASDGKVILSICDITDEKSVRNWVRGVPDIGGTPESFARAGMLGLPLMVATVGGETKRFRPLIEIYRE